jgi:hypothetical protein
MSIETGSHEELAMLIYHYREALGPYFKCPPSSSPEWDELSVAERGRMIAAVGIALLDLRSEPLLVGDVPPIARAVRGGTEGKECGC